ncbi:uncharacterized protein BKA78DRAFT_68185 [Phyllosticta capitalensis]|uniref:uncharacterized protein n=1 Tax=Phyllosticta capitalensis TaxID=121624 RepID=UPI00312D61F7
MTTSIVFCLSSCRLWYLPILSCPARGVLHPPSKPFASETTAARKVRMFRGHRCDAPSCCLAPRPVFPQISAAPAPQLQQLSNVNVVCSALLCSPPPPPDCLLFRLPLAVRASLVQARVSGALDRAGQVRIHVGGSVGGYLTTQVLACLLCLLASILSPRALTTIYPSIH